MKRKSVFWFRRDLRLDDQAGLFHALQDSDEVHCVFVFDTLILSRLASRRDRRVAFIHRALAGLDAALRERGSALHVLHGDPVSLIPEFASSVGASSVYVNRDYEPYAVSRDASVRRTLDALGISMRDFKDQVIFDRGEILTATGKPYAVFTPYRNAWMKRLGDADIRPYPNARHFDALARLSPEAIPGLADLGFEEVDSGVDDALGCLGAFLPGIGAYAGLRDDPSAGRTSRLSVHLRFGTISVRRLVGEARARSEAWLSELVWREFFQMLLHHYPRVVDQPFRQEFSRLEFSNDPALFEAWKNGMTGYPFVDAGMRELKATGTLHNRLRMVTASFLVKDLLIDWRWGERHFAEHLLDYDLAANNGNWQWVASTGCDAQPWFRIFNPVSQSKKFDPDGKYIRRHVPELSGCPDRYIHTPWLMPGLSGYPAPVVDHDVARRAALALYGRIRA